MKFITKLSLIAFAATLGTSAFAQQYDSDRAAEARADRNQHYALRADPHRWSIPDVTPQQRYQTSVKEANAAYGEALRECRQMRRHEQDSCRREARVQQQRELRDARRFMHS